MGRGSAAAPSPAPTDKTVRLWDVETGRACACSKATRTRSVSVAWSADRRRASPAPMTKPCGCGTWRPGAACACSKATPAASVSVAWSADGRRALSGSDDKTVRLWDVETGAACACSKATTAPVSERGCGAPINARAFSGDGRRHPGVGSVGIRHRGAGTRTAPWNSVSPRRTRSNTRTPKSSSSARAARARRGFPSGWLWMTGNPATRRSAPGRRSGSCPCLPATASSGKSGSGISAARRTSG